MAVGFGASINSTSYYDINGTVTLSGDFSIGFWIRPGDYDGSSYLLSYPISCGDPLGNPNSLHFFIANSFSPAGRMTLRMQSTSGSELIVDDVVTWPAISADLNYLVVLQRSGTTIEIYIVEAGDTGLTPATHSFDSDDIVLSSMRVGTRNYSESDRYFQDVFSELWIITGDTLSSGEVESLASGLPFIDVYNPNTEIGTGELWLQFITADTTIVDQFSTHDAALTGTDVTTEPHPVTYSVVNLIETIMFGMNF